jgi:hypothetical protein
MIWLSTYLITRLWLFHAHAFNVFYLTSCDDFRNVLNNFSELSSPKYLNEMSARPSVMLPTLFVATYRASFSACLGVVFCFGTWYVQASHCVPLEFFLLKCHQKSNWCHVHRSGQRRVRADWSSRGLRRIMFVLIRACIGRYVRTCCHYIWLRMGVWNGAKFQILIEDRHCLGGFEFGKFNSDTWNSDNWNSDKRRRPLNFATDREKREEWPTAKEICSSPKTFFFTFQVDDKKGGREDNVLNSLAQIGPGWPDEFI